MYLVAPFCVARVSQARSVECCIYPREGSQIGRCGHLSIGNNLCELSRALDRMQSRISGAL
jgi:hypothetical protein